MGNDYEETSTVGSRAKQVDYKFQRSEKKNPHRHKHVHQCHHNRVKYCSVCDVCYCLDCEIEWQGFNWVYHSNPFHTSGAPNSTDGHPQTIYETISGGEFTGKPEMGRQATVYGHNH